MAGKRLMKDYKELEDSITPLVGVNAAPLENSIFTWHGNFRGVRSSVWQNSIVHFELTFTDHYPFVPPKCKILSPHQVHQCIGEDNILTDEIFKVTGNKQYQGWAPAYTVYSILMQL